MTSKFEQLIEFVINDEETAAKELFHEIVVEESRKIYESLMDDGDAADDLITDVETEEEGMSEGEEVEFDDDEGEEEFAPAGEEEEEEE